MDGGGTTPEISASSGNRPAGVRQAREIRSARLESVRAVAALAVLEGHVYGANLGYGPTAYSSWWHRTLLGGGFGVYLFFTLSGYLLYLPFARRDLASGHRTDLRSYARNRALRILPLYYVVAVTYLLVFHARAKDWAIFLVFGETFFRSTIGRIDGPMWSLVVELLFYVMLPLLALGVAKLSRGSLRRAALVLGLVGLAAAAYRWAAYLGPPHPSPLVQYNLPATFYFFVPGMLLAVARVAAEQRPASQSSGLLDRSGLWLLASSACWSLVFLRYRWDLLAGVGSFLLVGACVIPVRRSAGLAALEWKPLAVLGTASYSLYLWHLPIIYALANHRLGGYLGHLLVGASVCVLVALASYRIVEVPFLRLRRRWGDTAARHAVAESGAP